MRRARPLAALVVAALALAGCAPSASLRGSEPPRPPVVAPAAEGQAEEYEEEGGREQPRAGREEGREAETASEQYMQQRLAPSGLVAPGAYGAAARAWQALPQTAGSWTHVTTGRFNSDDPRFAGPLSNAGAGFTDVSGRVAAVATDGPVVFAAGAAGGVWRSSTGTGGWEPIADRLPALSTGGLLINDRPRAGAGTGWLWLATGDGTTSAGSFLGSGVYALASPRTGEFAPGDRVGGPELESVAVRSLVLSPDGSTVYAATNRGLWRHSATTRTGGWTQVLAPAPAYLPAFPTAAPPRGAGRQYRDSSAAYRNWVNDVAIDPRDPLHLVAAVGWRGGAPLPLDPDGGMYETRDGGATWVRTTLGGVFAPDDVGNTTFAASADGSRLYALVQSPRLLLAGAPTMLLGVFVSANGDPGGPWQLVADGSRLASFGSAWSTVGFQSWYNQFLGVDPADDQHVYLGLEEVFETRDGGATWAAVGPYWNFDFACWKASKPVTPTSVRGCPRTTHADQHAVAFGTSGATPTVFVGGDGGVYARPSRGRVNADLHATDWVSLNDGTLDTLQYYAIGVGAVNPSNRGARALGWKSGLVVTGGLQDNGHSITRLGDPVMGSQYGGDGGDTIVDPRDGCRLVGEYVFLAMKVATNCATSLDKTAQYKIKPTGETAARFIAPFAADPANIDSWIAGGRRVWTQSKGFAITSGDEWTAQYDLGVDATSGSAHVATAVAISGRRAYVAWCGPCDTVGFSRGIATGLVGDPGSWKQLPLRGVPERYLSSIAIDPADSSRAYVAVSGFSRAWSEGPGAGVGHLYRTTDAGASWKNVTGNLPDVPTTSVRLLGDTIALGTDFGVAASRDGGRTWSRLGSGLPLTAVTDLESGPDGRLYAGTFGRGIWSIAPNP